MFALFIMLKVFEVGKANDISWAWLAVLFLLEMLAFIARRSLQD